MPTPLPTPAWLFVPGTRPDRFERAAAAADTTILDLEDAVAANSKEEARRNVVEALRVGTLDPERTIVRCNNLATPLGRRDVEALADTPLEFIMVPKAETPVATDITGRFSTIPLCETPRGLLTILGLVDGPRTAALTWGRVDLSAELGTAPLTSPAHRPTLHEQYARTMVTLAAATGGVLAVDTVFPSISDEDGLFADAREAAELGFDAKMVIHPGQIPIVRRAFHPSDAELNWARRVDAAAQAVEDGGVVRVGGEMVDQPVIRHARRLLARAAALGATDGP